MCGFFRMAQNPLPDGCSLGSVIFRHFSFWILRTAMSLTAEPRVLATMPAPTEHASEIFGVHEPSSSSSLAFRNAGADVTSALRNKRWRSL